MKGTNIIVHRVNKAIEGFESGFQSLYVEEGIWNV
jgi:hypothetical protein